MDESILPLPYSPRENGVDQARSILERFRWPNGPVCPSCGSQRPLYKQTRNGVTGYYQCPNRDNHTSGKPLVFTVRTGTLLERSHVPLDKWLFCLAWFARLPSVHWRPTASALARVVNINRKTASSLLKALEILCYGHEEVEPSDEFLLQLMKAILKDGGDLRQARR